MLVPLAILPLILSLSYSLLQAASMATARVLGPSLRTSPHSSQLLKASIYTSAVRACIRPLFQVASLRNASAARPAILSLRSSMASLSPCRNLNNFLTALMAVCSLAYCWTRADFSSVQVRAVFSLYNPLTYLETGSASYTRRTISWSDKTYYLLLLDRLYPFLQLCWVVLKRGQSHAWSTVIFEPTTLILMPSCYNLPLNYKRQQKRKTHFTQY